MNKKVFILLLAGLLSFAAVHAFNIYLLNLKTGVMWEKAPDEIFKKVAHFQVLHEQ